MSDAPRNLADFLRARYAEQRAIALAAGGKEWAADRFPEGTVVRPADSRRSLLMLAADGQRAAGTPVVGLAVGKHIANNDPAAVLADLDAKEAILREHQALLGPGWCQTCDVPGDYRGNAHGCPTVRLLAAPFADHTDYDQDWRP